MDSPTRKRAMEVLEEEIKMGQHLLRVNEERLKRYKENNLPAVLWTGVTLTACEHKIVRMRCKGLYSTREKAREYFSRVMAVDASFVGDLPVHLLDAASQFGDPFYEYPGAEHKPCIDCMNS